LKYLKRKRTLRKLLLFLIILNLLSIPLYIVIKFEIELKALKTFTTEIIFRIFQIFHKVEKIRYDTLYFKDYELKAEITTDSTGWKSFYLFFSLILSTFLVLRKINFSFAIKLFLLLFFINIFRIFITIEITLLYGIFMYNLFHIFLWRELMIFFVCIFFYFYLNSIIHRK